MNHDPFEQFVKDHKDEFDHLVPREDLFEQIETRKPKVIRMSTMAIFTRAIAAMLIFAVGFVANDFISSNRLGDSRTGDMPENVMEASYKDFYEMQMYYTQQIDLVKNDIVVLSGGDEVINEEIDLQLEDLKSIFEELKRDLNDRTNDEEVIEAMIMNYRVKLKMLEEMKIQLEPKTNNNEEDRYETTDI